MKKLLIFILFFSIFATSLCAKEEETNTEPAFVTSGKNLFEAAKLLDAKYPDTQIDQSLIIDLQEILKIDEEKAEDIESYIRYSIKYYRYFNKKYQEIKEKMLVPQAPPLNLEKEDFKPLLNLKYIESDDLVVTNNFLKVVPYFTDRKNFEAWEKRHITDLKNNPAKTQFEAIRQQIARLEFRKLLDYDNGLGNPFTANEGQGNWAKNQNVSARIISLPTKIENDSTIQAALHFFVPAGYAIKALSFKPKITFDDSKNLKSGQIHYPISRKYLSEDKLDTGFYWGNFAIPLTLEIEDNTKPLKLMSQIELTVCNVEKCWLENVQPSLEIEVGKAFDGATSNFIRQSFNALPLPQSSKIKIQSFQQDENGDVVLLIDTSLESNFIDVFIEDGANNLFYRPKILINNNQIRAKFTPVIAQNYVGQEFEITIAIGAKHKLQAIKTLEKQSVLFNNTKTPLGIAFIWALITGICLNIMPVVLALIITKLQFFNNMMVDKNAKIKKNIKQTIVGIVLALIFMVIILINNPEIWGKQLHNPLFLLLMIFIMTMFLCYNFGWIIVSFKGRYILSGILLVWLATLYIPHSDNNPYLMFVANALGFIMPYFLLYYYPQVLRFLPKPGIWIEKLAKIISITLVLTIIWLIMLLAIQTNFKIVTALILINLIAIFLLWARTYSIQTIELKKLGNKAKKTINKIYAGIIISLFIILAFFTNQSLIKKTNLIDNEIITQTQIDEYLNQGKKVFIKIDANWCLTCKINDIFAFSKHSFKSAVKQDKIKLIELDYTKYNKNIMNYMQKFGRNQPPFYILFTPYIPDGIVLPQLLNHKNISVFIN